MRIKLLFYYMASKKEIMDMLKESNISDWYTINRIRNKKFGTDYIFSPDIRLRIEIHYHEEMDYRQPVDDFHETLDYKGPRQIDGYIKYDNHVIKVLNLIKYSDVIFPTPEINNKDKDFINEREYKISKILSSKFRENNLSKERLNRENVYIR